MGNATTNTSATTLSDSERIELEQYRKAEKLAMIADYKGELQDSLIVEFENRVDEFNKDSLASALAIEFRKAVKNAKTENKTQPAQVMAFGLINNPRDYDENNPADVINRYKNK